MRLVGLVMLGLVGNLWGGEVEDAKAAWAEVDGRLNRAYGALKAALGEEGFERAKLEQRGWIGYRDYMAEWLAQTEGQAEEGKEETVARYWEVMGELSETRAAVLEGMATAGEVEGWGGRWTDSYGGGLHVVPTGESGFKFLLTVVRGPTYHIGEIGGEVEVKGRIGRFEVKDEFADEATWLTFLKRDDGRVEIVGANTSTYHGARAYFDGKYVKTAELSADERAAVVRGSWEEDR